jgi:hypothetical protein
MNNTTITRKINNFESAIEALSAAIENDQEHFSLCFENWPKLNIVFEGDNYDGVLPARVLKSLWDMQDKLNKVYADLALDGNRRKFNSDLRESLELYYTIEKGCVNVNIDASEFFKRLGDAMMDKDNFRFGAIAVGAVMLSFVGAYAAISINDSNNQLEAETAVHKSHTEQIITITNAMNENTKLLSAKNEIETAKEAIAASAFDADSVTVADKVYSKADIAELARKTRSATTPELTTDVYLIDGIKGVTYHNEKTAVSLLLQQTGEIVNCTMNKDDMDAFSQEEIDLLFDAFKNEQPVVLTLKQSKKTDGSVTKSTIVAIKKAEAKQ